MIELKIFLSLVLGTLILGNTIFCTTIIYDSLCKRKRFFIFILLNYDYALCYTVLKGSDDYEN